MQFPYVREEEEKEWIEKEASEERAR